MELRTNLTRSLQTASSSWCLLMRCSRNLDFLPFQLQLSSIHLQWYFVELPEVLVDEDDDELDWNDVFSGVLEGEEVTLRLWRDVGRGSVGVDGRCVGVDGGRGVDALGCRGGAGRVSNWFSGSVWVVNSTFSESSTFSCLMAIFGGCSITFVLGVAGLFERPSNEIDIAIKVPLEDEITWDRPRFESHKPEMETSIHEMSADKSLLSWLPNWINLKLAFFPS